MRKTNENYVYNYDILAITVYLRRDLKNLLAQFFKYTLLL
jgi:hypothetical protein